MFDALTFKTPLLLLSFGGGLDWRMGDVGDRSVGDGHDVDLGARCRGF